MNRTLAAMACSLVPFPAKAQVVNPEVTQDTVQKTICTPGWTLSERPPTFYKEKIKRDLVTDFGGDPKDYELDHVIPLAVGGDPTGPQNLALQPWDGPDGAKAKDAT